LVRTPDTDRWANGSRVKPLAGLVTCAWAAQGIGERTRKKSGRGQSCTGSIQHASACVAKCSSSGARPAVICTTALCEFMSRLRGSVCGLHCTGCISTCALPATHMEALSFCLQLLYRPLPAHAVPASFHSFHNKHVLSDTYVGRLRPDRHRACQLLRHLRPCMGPSGAHDIEHRAALGFTGTPFQWVLVEPAWQSQSTLITEHGLVSNP
jgi:hypothetical protein